MVRNMNQNIDESVSSGISVTPAARSKITELLANADESQSAVRVFVAGGGCGGMSYGMTFAESISDKDRLMKDEDGFALTIDPVALSYLQGAEIDFQDSDVNATFVFNNVFQAVGGSGACGGCGGAH
jgi:iron-sulfur cluster assembly accessory protein